MTPRERAALTLTGIGAAQLVAAAYGFGGWRAAALVNGGLLLVAGIALGYDTDDGVPEAGEPAAGGEFEWAGRTAR